MLQFQHQIKTHSSQWRNLVKNIVPCPHCGQPLKAQEIIKSLDKSEHTCLECGKTFIAPKKAKYCSNACRQRAKYARKKQQKQGESNGKNS